MYTIFIDGGEGTTGLKIASRLRKREDLTLLSIEEKDRKDPQARLEKMKQADITFLCLPEDAAAEAAGWAPPGGKLIDTSTAHRTDPDWAYGFPELEKGRREQIRNALRVSVPGCHATGVIAAVRPLREAGLLSSKDALSAFSLTGYSGGGKKMIAQYGAEDRDPEFSAPRIYAPEQRHKHLPEILAMAKLETAPVFLPVVADYYSGMLVTVPLPEQIFSEPVSREEILTLYREYYRDEPMIRVGPQSESFLSANVFSGFDDMELLVGGSDRRITVSVRYDNLGKGASGAAIQCMNLMLGAAETKGLKIKRNEEKA